MDQSLLTWWHIVINIDWVSGALATSLWWLHYKQKLACTQSTLGIFCCSNISFVSNKTSPLISFSTAFFIGTESKMKLWDVLATCLLLLSSAATRPLYQNTQPAKRTYFPSSYSDSTSLSVEDEETAFQREDHNLQEISMENQCKAPCSVLTAIFCGVRSPGERHLNGW